jgi:hypothetical protein
MKLHIPTLGSRHRLPVSKSRPLRTYGVRRLVRAIPGLPLAATLLAGCGSSLVGPSVATTGLAFPPVAACTDTGLAAEDLAGQCRTTPTTMGALEATGASTATAVARARTSAASPALRLASSRS